MQMANGKDNAARKGTYEDVVRPTPRMMMAARELLGLTQRQLADRAGVSFSALRRFEGGSMNTRLGTLDKLATALNEEGIRFRVTADEVQVALAIKPDAASHPGT